jgi:hypothetical protein
MASKLIRIAAQHETRATDNGNGSATVYVPYVDRNGSAGEEPFVVWTVNELLAALGY